jgi:hypothetical protein
MWEKRKGPGQALPRNPKESRIRTNGNPKILIPAITGPIKKKRG